MTACREENGWGDSGNRDTDAQWIRKVTLQDPKSGWSGEAPGHVPALRRAAVRRRLSDRRLVQARRRLVLVDKHICIGCRYCMMACPYKARSFVHEPIDNQKPNAPRGKGTVESCTMCVDRIDAGRQPACVEACSAKAGGAMTFGDLNDPESDIAKAVRARASDADPGRPRARHRRAVPEHLERSRQGFDDGED